MVELIRRFCIVSYYSGHTFERTFFCPCFREWDRHPDYYEVDVDLPDETLIKKLMNCFKRPRPVEPKPELV